MRKLVLVALLALTAPVGAQTTIDTRVGGSTDSYVGFGEYDELDGTRELYSRGQTFLAPTEAPILDTFSFWFSATADHNPASLFFRAYLLEWNRETGSTAELLWSSPTALSGTANTDGYDNYWNDIHDGSGWMQRTFSTGGLRLSSSSVYMLALSSAADPGEHLSGQHSMNLLRMVINSSYALGDYVALNSYGVSTPADAGSVLGNTGWSGLNTPDQTYDLDFQANFIAEPAVVPEPVSMILLGTGLAGVGIARHRRRKEPSPDA